MKYTYPVIFYDDEGKIGVTVPDIPDCNTFGDDMPDAIRMAEDALGMLLAAYEDDKTPIPPASDIRSVKTDGIVSLVLADTDEWRRKFDNRAVKKTLTLPSWLCRRAEKAGVNFSQTLQESLIQKLSITA